MSKFEFAKNKNTLAKVGASVLAGVAALALVIGGGAKLHERGEEVREQLATSSDFFDSAAVKRYQIPELPDPETSKGFDIGHEAETILRGIASLAPQDKVGAPAPHEIPNDDGSESGLQPLTDKDQTA